MTLLEKSPTASSEYCKVHKCAENPNRALNTTRNTSECNIASYTPPYFPYTLKAGSNVNVILICIARVHVRTCAWQTVLRMY